jgi:hypothetical protein
MKNDGTCNCCGGQVARFCGLCRLCDECCICDNFDGARDDEYTPSFAEDGFETNGWWLIAKRSRVLDSRDDDGPSFASHSDVRCFTGEAQSTC